MNFSKLPKYVKFDRSSEWNTSALSNTAIESLTLPSRLRSTNSLKAGHLDEIEAILNTNGNQRIANLQCRVLSPDDIPNKNKDSARSGVRDERLHNPLTEGSSSSTLKDAEDDRVGSRSSDIDFFPLEGQTQPSGTPGRLSKTHVFAQVESLRMETKLMPDQRADQDDKEETYQHNRRRVAGLPIIERYTVP